jgi:hypothetical protein
VFNEKGGLQGRPFLCLGLLQRAPNPVGCEGQIHVRDTGWSQRIQ